MKDLCKECYRRLDKAQRLCFKCTMVSRRPVLFELCTDCRIVSLPFPFISLFLRLCLCA